MRCIKPNSTKAPGKFEIPLVVEQLRYCGIVETVKIRKAGYPIRYGYADFIKRYQCISSHVDLSSPNQRENVSRLLKLLDKIEPESFQFGKTKVFLKEDLHGALEEARMAKLNRMAIVIQARMRGYYLDNRYLKKKKAAIVIQSNTRCLLERSTSALFRTWATGKEIYCGQHCLKSPKNRDTESVFYLHEETQSLDPKKS